MRKSGSRWKERKRRKENRKEECETKQKLREKEKSGKNGKKGLFLPLGLGILCVLIIVVVGLVGTDNSQGYMFLYSESNDKYAQLKNGTKDTTILARSTSRGDWEQIGIAAVHPAWQMPGDRCPCYAFYPLFPLQPYNTRNALTTIEPQARRFFISKSYQSAFSDDIMTVSYTHLTIMFFTFVCEAFGSFLLMLRFVPMFGGKDVYKRQILIWPRPCLPSWLLILVWMLWPMRLKPMFPP